MPNKPLPMTMQEAKERGWDEIDIVVVTGDAYVDHPSFGSSIIGRVLENAGYRVGIIAMPEKDSPEAMQVFGLPKLFFAVSSGNIDSMVANYTAFKKFRSDDPYAPGGEAGHRPDRALINYCNSVRRAYKGVPLAIGGIEASMRRIPHYDFWSNKVRRSILLDTRADILAFGMAEEQILEIARRYKNDRALTGKTTGQRGGRRHVFQAGCAAPKFCHQVLLEFLHGRFTHRCDQWFELAKTQLADFASRFREDGGKAEIARDGGADAGGDHAAAHIAEKRTA